MSSALVPYRGQSSPTTLTTSTYMKSTSLLSSRLFTAQTGQALAAELLYRLLFDIFNRLLATIHRELAHQLDTFSAFLERRYTARSETLDAVKAARENAAAADDAQGGLKIIEEVGRMAAQRGFIGGPGGGGFTPCSSTQNGEWRRPGGWVGEVLDGIHEGRMVEKDFWVHPFVN
jgi:hypothetical protein